MFSVLQEVLMNQFEDHKVGYSSFNTNIEVQQDLRLQFKYVDDNLFAKSLVNLKIAVVVAQEIGNVYFNIDRFLMSFVVIKFSRNYPTNNILLLQPINYQIYQALLFVCNC